jgi:hypothetical protein
MKNEQFFCSSFVVPDFCIYPEKPRVCCFRCDVKDDCWGKQQNITKKIPCLVDDKKNGKKCEFLY